MSLGYRVCYSGKNNRVLYGLFPQLDKPRNVSREDKLQAREWRAALALAGIFFLRLLGLFMLLPVLALYGERLAHATPLLIGLALGIYGLSQALMQIPMGLASDRFGRKPVIALGLLVFSLGGAIAATSGQIFFIIAGRAVQGAGAVSGATLALAADLTREDQRTKVMGIIGVTIGLSFSLAFILGPLIDSWLGLTGLFWVASALGLVALPILMFVVPAPQLAKAEPIAEPLFSISHELRSVYFGVFCLHGILAASFVAIPVALTQNVGIDAGIHYRIYIPVLLCSLFVVGPLLAASHRKSFDERIFLLAIVLIIIGELGLWLAPPTALAIGVALTAFFIGFNYLEASMPSLVSRLAPSAKRGAALGTYASAQFLGMFCGGIFGGFIAGSLGFSAVFPALAVVALIWFVWAASSNY